MTRPPAETPVTFTLDLYDLHWLHAYLKEERLAAEIDLEEVERLHTDAAIRAAKVTLNKELAQMTKIIEALDEALAADDKREALARKISATLPVALQASNEVVAAMEEER